MNELNELRKDAHVAMWLEHLQARYFDDGGWAELEQLINDTVAEFGAVVDVDVTKIPAWEQLTDVDRERLGEALAAYMNAFAHRVRAPVLIQLIMARVQLWTLERTETQMDR